jgi:hypothetical protein
MASTFLRKLSRNIGTSLSAVGSYTVGANIGAVVVGLNISNTSVAQITANVVINNGTDDFYLGNRIPVAAGGAVSIAGGDQKIILQTGDSVKVNSSAASSVDVLMNIMETEGVGVTDDSPAPPGTTFTQSSYSSSSTSLSAVKDGGGYKYISAQRANWAVPADYDTLEAQSSTAVFTVVLTGGTYTFTATSKSGTPGTDVQWYGNYDPVPSGMFNEAPISITFTP